MANAQSDLRGTIVPRRTRWFVRLFLTAFVVCGVVGIEAWPLTGFRLFSHLRQEQTVGWERTAMGTDGKELDVDLTKLPYGHRSFVLVVRSFDSRPKGQQDAMCRTWVSGLHRLDPRVSAMRVYRVDRSLAPRSGGRPTSRPERTLLFVCTESGVLTEGAGA